MNGSTNLSKRADGSNAVRRGGQLGLRCYAGLPRCDALLYRKAPTQWACPRHLAKQPRGAVLLIVLIAIVIMALSAYTFSILMVTEDEATRLMGKQLQSRYLVESGVDYLKLYLSQDPATIREAGGTWDVDRFNAVPVSEDPHDPENLGRFTIVTSSIDEEGAPMGYRFGLQDESTKLNLNTLLLADEYLPGAGRQLLMALPYMTEEIADAILDWIDEDDDPRDFGVESSFYASQDPPYNCKNGPMDSIEELLLVRGVTPELLFGIDNNRNGLVDTEELNSPSATALDPQMQLGWSNYLTLFSKESNLNREGLPRIDINRPDLQALETELRSVLDERWTTFILAYRQNGPYTGSDEPNSDGYYADLDLTGEATTSFSQVLDLVDAQTTVPDPEDPANELVIDSPVKSTNLPLTLPVIMDNLTTIQSNSIPGRININRAPRRILENIPGMQPEIVDEIIRVREFVLDDPDGSDRNRQYGTWILTEGIVSLSQMRTMFPFVCAGGDVYSAEIVGYHDDGIGTSRAEVILDTTTPLPRVLFWRDKTHLQTGYSLAAWGIELQSSMNSQSAGNR